MCRAISVALLALASVAQAGAPPERFMQRLRKDDKNNDGKVTRKEFSGPQRLFDQLARGGVIDVARVEREGIGGRQRGNPRRGPVAPEGFEVLKDVEFGTTGDRPLKLDLVRPKAKPAMPLPIVVWIHGGAWRAGTKSLGRVMPLVERGYAVAAITYRLSQEAQWPAQIQDCKCAIRWLRAHAAEHGIDPDRIGVWGSSAGGHLVAMLGTAGDVEAFEGAGGWPDQSSRVQAVCDFYGPSDFLRMRGC